MIITATDYNYLPRALVLIHSIWQHMPNTEIAALCMDDITFNKLNIRCGSFTKLYKADDLNLFNASPKVRACLAKSFMLLKLLKECKDEWLIWLDSDMMLFSKLKLPEDYETLTLTPHRYSTKFFKFRNTAGYYNAGFFGIKTTNKNKAKQILEHWQKLCIEGKPASDTLIYGTDQKYLEFLTEQYGVNEIKNTGINAAPWNISRYTIENKSNNIILHSERDDNLQLYHFQGMQIYQKFVDYYCGEDLKLSKIVRKLIYKPYIEKLRIAYEDLQITPDKITFRKVYKSVITKSNLYIG